MLERLIQSFDHFSGKVAFCIKDVNYTYHDFGGRVLAIQKRLIEEEDGQAKKPIGIICNDDLDTYAAIVAVLLTGHSYIPISLNNPIDRNLKVIQDSGIEFLLSSTTINISELAAFPIVDLNSILNQGGSLEYRVSSLEEPAYTLYTSGSTGIPKGVPISFRNLNAFLDSFEELHILISEEDRCLQMFELTFDVSIACLLIPLLHGATIYTIPNDTIKYIYILKLLTKNNLTHITIVPSIITLIKPYWNKLKFESLRECILTAEASYIDQVEVFQNMAPSARITNLYGPTEATVWCTGLHYNRNSIKQYNGMFAIGKPFKHVKALVADSFGNEMASMQKGELLISGDQVTAGYAGDLPVNKTAFVNISEDGSLVRYYKTGDLCFKDDEGDIYYCGRIDNQVQIQGFRVELSEIEVHVRDRFKINNVVIPVKNKADTLELYLFLENCNLEFSEIRNYLTEKLPVYMIPSKSINIIEFPLNLSGKIDRIKLKSLV